MRLRGKVWLFGHDINTDLVYPGTSFRLSLEEQAQLVFSANRPGWAQQVESGDIIVGGRNFGTGSARPGAVLLKQLALGGLVADSIDGVFYRNCVNYGIPVLQCPGVHDAFEEGDAAEIELLSGTVTNLRTAKSLQGIAVPASIVRIIEAGGILPHLRTEGYFN